MPIGWSPRIQRTGSLHLQFPVKRSLSGTYPIKMLRTSAIRNCRGHSASRPPSSRSPGTPSFPTRNSTNTSKSTGPPSVGPGRLTKTRARFCPPLADHGPELQALKPAYALLWPWTAPTAHATLFPGLCSILTFTEAFESRPPFWDYRILDSDGPVRYPQTPPGPVRTHRRA